MPADHTVSAQALHTLYSDYHGWLLNWLHRRVGCRHDSADLAHDTFLRLLTRSHCPAIDDPKAYLTTIARGLMVDHWRRQDIERAYREALALRADHHQPSPQDQALIVEALLAVDKLLHRLPTKIRQAFLLSQLEGLTYGEIATLLGVSERTVKKYMARAMAHCLLAWDDHGPA